MLRCLIVDDEPPAHKVLENYIGKMDSLQLAGNCYSAAEAINFLQRESVDILFLDIEMPDLSGLQMLKAIKDPPAVILTTAYSQFALESYELGVVDYLLKPIRFERFVKSVQRILPVKPGDSFFVKTSGSRLRVVFSEVRYLDAYGNFVRIHLDNGFILAPGTLTEIADRFPSGQLLRIHRSYFVSRHKIDKIAGNEVFIASVRLPVSQRYKELLYRVLGLE
ncbi:MAG: response regulator transcription factor [Bacteroidales bacterium]|nr:response regulator transcription factor [Bacteroidales bacterium]